MFLHPTPSLADVADLTPAQLDCLTRSVEQRRQKLEGDIQDYIKQKQHDLERYEGELLDSYHSMERTAPVTRGPVEASRPHSPTSMSEKSPTLPTASPDAESTESTESKKLGPPETAKRTKHTRVQKREQELCGLVTPIFLPLLDARGVSPPKKKKEKRRQHQEESVVAVDPASGQGEMNPENARSSSRNRVEQVDRKDGMVVENGGGESGSRPKEEGGKKPRRATAKKSALRHEKTPKSRRKRVSLVIDDQIVLPADTIAESVPMMSPSETSVSTTSNSTTSLDEMIDPQLLDRHDVPAHQDPVHHSLPSQEPRHHYDPRHESLYRFSDDSISRSLPLPMSIPTTSPTRQPAQYISESPPTVHDEAPPAPTRSFLDPSPSGDIYIPPYASAAPIYANEPELADAPEEDYTALVQSEAADNFDTYVGGPSGSGVDDVNQAGSYGYPSSLGASYMESYMKNRPLSVRIAAAEKADLNEHEKKALIAGEGETDVSGLGEDLDQGMDEVDDGMEIIGDMEGF